MDRIFHREGLGTPDDDAVGDDEADEDRELLAELVGEGLDDLVGGDDQRGDDR
jgi:hypothetical protein